MMMENGIAILSHQIKNARGNNRNQPSNGHIKDINVLKVVISVFAIGALTNIK